MQWLYLQLGTPYHTLREIESNRSEVRPANKRCW